MITDVNSPLENPPTYTCEPMSQEQIDAFLNDVRNAVFATNRRDGAPQLSTVWYVYDQGLIYVGFDAHCAKHRNIMRDHRVSLCIGGEPPDSRTITIYGTADFVEEDNPRFVEIRELIDRRYAESEEDYQRLRAISLQERDSKMVAVKPGKIIAMDYND